MSNRISHIKKQPFCYFCKRVEKPTFGLVRVRGFHLAEQKAMYRNRGNELKVSQEIQLVVSHCRDLNLICVLSSGGGCRELQPTEKGKKVWLTKISHNSWNLCTCKICLLIKGMGIYSVSQCEKEEVSFMNWHSRVVQRYLGVSWDLRSM